MASFGPIKQAIFDKEARKQQYQAHIKGLNAYQRHKKFLDDYGVLKYMNDEQSPSLRWKGGYNCSYSIFDLIDQMTFYGKENSAKEKLPIKTDQDTLREGYRFIRTEEDDLNPSWEQRLVKRYYDKLFKEYCIADMSHYKTGKIGLRWRTEKEVISGKGQFICGNKHCNERDGLASYEVNFSYSEAGENKQALVKLLSCERCAEKLVYKRQKEKEKEKERQKQKEALRRKRERSESDDDTDSESDRRKDRRKGKKTSSSAIDHKKVDDENFDEYLEGMFP